MLVTLASWIAFKLLFSVHSTPFDILYEANQHLYGSLHSHILRSHFIRHIPRHMWIYPSAKSPGPTVSLSLPEASLAGSFDYMAFVPHFDSASCSWIFSRSGSRLLSQRQYAARLVVRLAGGSLILNIFLLYAHHRTSDFTRVCADTDCRWRTRLFTFPSISLCDSLYENAGSSLLDRIRQVLANRRLPHHHVDSRSSLRHYIHVCPDYYRGSF
jgi:hypothetical protein